MKTHVNLLVSDLFGEDRFPFQKVVLPGAFLLLILAIPLGTAVELTRSKSLKQEIKVLNERRAFISQSLGTLKSETAEILRQAQSASEGSDVRDRLLNQLDRERIPWSSLVREVSFLVPNNVWLTHMEGMDDLQGTHAPGQTGIIREIKFMGFASSYAAVTQWMSALEHSRYFRHVELILAKRDSGERQNKVMFEMKATLKQAR